MIGSYITVNTRAAVPIFFIISGFFYYTQNARTQIRKVTTLFVAGNLMYFFLRLMSAVLKKDINTLIGELLAPKSIVAFIIFNESPLYAHLWYLGAILYVLFIVMMLFIDIIPAAA